MKHIIYNAQTGEETVVDLPDPEIIEVPPVEEVPEVTLSTFTFTQPDGRVVTVVNGQITSIT